MIFCQCDDEGCQAHIGLNAYVPCLYINDGGGNAWEIVLDEESTERLILKLQSFKKGVWGSNEHS